MKFAVLLLLLIISVVTVSAQGCLPQGITFYTQQDIDNFQTQYPDCQDILGEVQILGSNSISNLDGLSVVSSIGGNLTLLMCTALTTLNGLENLTTIGGDLRISQNSQLTSLSGLNNLSFVGGSVELIGNNQLTGLQGLENINPGNLIDLVIHDNPQLSICDIENICNYLTGPNGHVVIYNNGEGCHNPPDIAWHCGIILSCLPYGDYYLTSQTDIDHFAIDYSHCTQLEGVLKISGNDISNLDGLNEITSAGINLTIVQNPQLTNLNGLMNLNGITGAFSIGYNPWLNSLSGLENLTAIGGYLSVYNNSSLDHLGGLNNLTSTGGWLEIMNNEQLMNLDGLDRLTSIGGELAIRNNASLINLSGLGNVNPGSINLLTIVNNVSLSSCETASICQYLANPSGLIVIQNNAPGCNSPEEVEEACETLGTPRVNEYTGIRVLFNPVNEKITILPDNLSSHTITSIFDMIGNTILTTPTFHDNYELDMSRFPGGLYLIKIENEYGTNVIKLLKP